MPVTAITVVANVATVIASWCDARPAANFTFQQNRT
jgi:hypothetical protein